MAEYPEMITDLPRADIPFSGVRGWILQGEEKQVVFLDIDPIGEVAEHSHGAQMGVVIEGEMSLTIRGETKRYGKGDIYFVPEGVPHSAVFHSAFKAIDIFNDKYRYKPK
jgi:quercetin dioxygenase-like cupin family protein